MIPRSSLNSCANSSASTNALSTSVTNFFRRAVERVWFEGTGPTVHAWASDSLSPSTTTARIIQLIPDATARQTSGTRGAHAQRQRCRDAVGSVASVPHRLRASRCLIPTPEHHDSKRSGFLAWTSRRSPNSRLAKIIRFLQAIRQVAT